MTTDPALDLADVLTRYVAATQSVGTSNADLRALSASCADVPALLLEIQELRSRAVRNSASPGLLDSWMRHLAEHLDYELYRLRIAGERALAYLHEQSAPSEIVNPLADALAPPLRWANVDATMRKPPPKARRRQRATSAASKDGGGRQRE